MAALRRAGLEDLALEAATSGRPFLGVCIGMQMLFEGSDEAPGVEGLGVLPGRVTRLPATVKLPQIGWNTIEPVPGSALVAGLPDPAWLYFVHSYAPETDDAVVAALIGARPALPGRGRARKRVWAAPSSTPGKAVPSVCDCSRTSSHCAEQSVAAGVTSAGHGGNRAGATMENGASDGSVSVDRPPGPGRVVRLEQRRR